MAKELTSILRWIFAQGYLQKSSSIPSAQALAQSYGTSHRQMLRALHSLSDLGLIAIEHGGRIRNQGKVNVPKQETITTPVDAIDSVVEKLRNSIASAVWRSGNLLPKMAWLCQEWHSSTRSISGACRRLEQEGLLYKSGKAWIVGKPLATPYQKTSVLAVSKVIVLLCNRPEEWAEFHTNLLDGFVRTLGAELDRYGVRLVPFLTGDEACEQVFGVGRTELRKFILDQGEAYLGTLFTPLVSSMPEFRPWCIWLARFGKPVVSLQDDRPEDSYAEIKKFVRICYGDWIHAQSVEAEDLALQALIERGHRRIAFVCNGKSDFSWFRVRATRLAQKAVSLSVELLVYECVDADAKMMKWVQESGATALLCPNDRYAVRFWKVLKAQGVRIPRDLSMLSFDNLAELKPYPVSTIDFGLSLLGYQVFHLLLGDVPVKVSRSGQIFGLCRVIDNGSVTLPRKG